MTAEMTAAEQAFWRIVILGGLGWVAHWAYLEVRSWREAYLQLYGERGDIAEKGGDA